MLYTFAQLPPRLIEVEELPSNTVALNITKSVNKGGKEMLTIADIMAYTQRAWRLSADNAENTNLILATYIVPEKGTATGNKRLILGAFVFGRKNESEKGDCFVQSPYDEKGRCIFLAELAPEEYWKKYVGHYLPCPKQGEANPVRYYDQD